VKSIVGTHLEEIAWWIIGKEEPLEIHPAKGGSFAIVTLKDALNSFAFS
jgi:hypothetical protein